MPSDRKPKPVRAWAVVRHNGQIVRWSDGVPIILVRKVDILKVAQRGIGERPIRVLIVPETSDA